MTDDAAVFVEKLVQLSRLGHVEQFCTTDDPCPYHEGFRDGAEAVVKVLTLVVQEEAPQT